MQKIIVVILAFILGVSSEYLQFKWSDPSELFDADDSTSRYNGRCTRRYTAGTCGSEVAVVWTFVFQIQNCTERLGCPMSSRTNRFPSYRRCMRHCRALAALYAQVLAAGGRNDTDKGRTAAEIAELAEPGRRKAHPRPDYLTKEEPDTDLEYDNQYGDPALVNPPGYKYLSSLEEIIPPDIDYVRSEHLPNPYDPFHDIFGRH